MNAVNLNSFLKFGYFLDYCPPEKYFDLDRLGKSNVLQLPENELVKLGGELWMNAVSKVYSSSDINVVPLSGGFDSRALLGSLLRHTEAKNIQTYTFGTPGTFDFEIGNKIAKRIGTNHFTFDLTQHTYSQDELLDVSTRVNKQTILFHHGPVTLLHRLFGESTIWSGAIIDVFFGRHTHKNKADSVLDAVMNSFEENVYVRSCDLTNVRDELYLPFVNVNNVLDGRFPLEHEIDLLNRQLKFIAPHVLMDGFNYKTMLDEELIGFALSLDQKYLDSQALYKSILFHEFPYLFGFPTKTSYGLPLSSGVALINGAKLVSSLKNRMSKYFSFITNPHLNYIDFNRGIRYRDDLNRLVYRSIMDLKGRNIVPWIDLSSIWSRHIAHKGNHSDALIVLTSLEIHLKNGLDTSGL